MSTETVVLGESPGMPHDDASYDGPLSESSVSADYVRGKIREFQVVMNALHESYEAGLFVWNDTGQSNPRLDELLRDYESNSGQIKAIAETLNMGAELANATGFRMPALSIPQTLGIGPAGLLIPAAVVAALAAVSGWVVYAKGYAAGMIDAIAVVKAELGDTEQAGRIGAKLQAAADAKTKIDLPDISRISGVVKLASIAAIAFLGWKVWDAIATRASGGD